MSQQHTTQASGQGMLERTFKLREYSTTARAEVIAGLTTFLTVVYVVFVDSQIPGITSVDISVVFVTTCLTTVFGGIMMGLFTNLPVALVPTMGLNTFFAFVVVQAMGLPQQAGMGAIFQGVAGLLLLAILRVHCWMTANIPVNLRVDITSGIGLFIGMMELKNAGAIVANLEALVSIGNLTSHSVLLGILGFFITATLASRNTRAAVLVSIVVVTLLGWMLGDVHYNGIVSTPSSVVIVVGYVDLAGSFNLGLARVILFFMLINLFDSSGTLIGATDKTGLTDKRGKFPCMKQALYIGSISPVVDSLIGTSSVTAHIESSSGVSISGRASLTAMVASLLFLLVILLSPLVGMVPGCAVVGALIYVGVLMTPSPARVSRQDLTESTPAFIIAMVMPSSFSITEGIALGFISYCMMKADTGRLRDFSLYIIIVMPLLILKIVFIDAH